MEFHYEEFPDSSTIQAQGMNTQKNSTMESGGKNGNALPTSANNSQVNLGSKLLANGTTDVGLSAEPEDKLPTDLSELSESSKHYMIAYCILFVIATSGNLTVLLSVRNQYKTTKSRISLLILHLTIADLIVCCTLMPTEVFWRMTIQWRGGNLMCKVMQFLRAFGLYHSSMVLICVSLDRFVAIWFPMKTLKRLGHQRTKTMLCIAWIASTAFAAPQAILFSVASHPEYPSFKQCVTNEFLHSTELVRMYSIFSLSAMYFVPLIVTIFTYTAILIKLIQKARPNPDNVQRNEKIELQNRSSNQSRLSIRSSACLPDRSGQLENFNYKESSKCSTFGTHLIQQHAEVHHNHSNVSTNTIRQSQRKVLNIDLNLKEHSSIEEGNSADSTKAGNKPTETPGFPMHHSVSPPASPDIIEPDTNISKYRVSTVLRRSENAVEQMSRAKHRTLLMTIVIVAAFVVCWTPYVILTLWYMFDWEGARDVDPRIQDGLLFMAVCNSCINPLIYGSLTKNCCGLPKVFGRLRRTRG